MFPATVTAILLGVLMVTFVVSEVHLGIVLPRARVEFALTDTRLTEVKSAGGEPRAEAAMDQAEAHTASNRRRLDRAEVMKTRVYRPLMAVTGLALFFQALTAGVPDVSDANPLWTLAAAFALMVWSGVGTVATRRLLGPAQHINQVNQAHVATLKSKTATPSARLAASDQITQGNAAVRESVERASRFNNLVYTPVMLLLAVPTLVLAIWGVAGG